MKLNLFLILLLVATSCTMASKKSDVISLPSADLIGSYSKADILKKFGTPDQVDQFENNEYLNYNEAGFLRVKFVVDQVTQNLQSIMWFPRENEKEFSVQSLLSQYGKENFRVLVLASKNPHTPSPKYEYMNEKNKMIAYTENSPDHVEVIVFSKKIDRDPAAVQVQ